MPRRRPNEISAGGVLARRSSDAWEVCLVRAGRHWGFPKGHVEPEETTPQAALREISEECGLPIGSLSVIAELPSAEYVYRRAGRLRFKLVHHFLVIAPPGSEVIPQPGEIDEAAWFAMDDAIRQAAFPATRTALEAARPLLDAAG
jgi:8-oxo-dGTP pyrophosphatase MutT (NUDIX family)